MNITTAQYVDPEKTSIRAIIDGMAVSVPVEPANRHYAEIMRQVEAGELVIEDAE
jgi:hypothetical protein